MKLPNCENAIVEDRKLLDYLLSDRKEKLKELDIVVLQHDLPEHELRAGDIGTVVYKYDRGDAVEAEFVTGEGRTIGVITLDARSLRLMNDREILHVRSIHAA